MDVVWAFFPLLAVRDEYLLAHFVNLFSLSYITVLSDVILPVSFTTPNCIKSGSLGLNLIKKQTKKTHFMYVNMC